MATLFFALLRKLLTLLILAAGLLLTGLALVQAPRQPTLLLLLPLGLFLVIKARKLDRMGQRQTRDEHTLAVLRQSAAHTAEPWPADRRLTVAGPHVRLLAYTTVVLALGAALTYGGISTFPAHLSLLAPGVAILASGVLGLALFLPLLGQPALILDRRGFTTPQHGFIPWSAVQGIHLAAPGTRLGAIPMLEFKVPNYGKVVRPIRRPVVWLALLRLGPLPTGVVPVVLAGGQDGTAAEVAAQVAQFLWQDQRGPQAPWFPGLLEGYHRALHQGDQAAAARELKRALRPLNWQLALSLAGMVLAFLWPWLRR